MIARAGNRAAQYVVVVLILLAIPLTLLSALAHLRAGREGAALDLSLFFHCETANAMGRLGIEPRPY